MLYNFNKGRAQRLPLPADSGAAFDNLVARDKGSEEIILRGGSWLLPYYSKYLLVLISTPQAMALMHPRVTNQGLLLQVECAPFSGSFFTVRNWWVCDFGGGRNVHEVRRGRGLQLADRTKGWDVDTRKRAIGVLRHRKWS